MIAAPNTTAVEMNFEELLFLDEIMHKYINGLDNDILFYEGMEMPHSKAMAERKLGKAFDLWKKLNKEKENLLK